MAEDGSKISVADPATARDIALALVVGTGVLFRVLQWSAERSYYVDESALLLSVFRRPLPVLLTEPLLFDQTAPPGFLFLERISFELFGAGELATRFFPLLAAIATLPLFAVLARRLLPPFETVVVTAVLAVSPVHVYFAADAKPYSFDVLAAGFLLLWCHQLLTAPSSWRSLGLGLLTVAVALTLSQPAALVASVCAAIIGWSALRASGALRLRLGLAAGALGAMIIGAIVVAQARMTAGGAEYMRLFWESGFWPLPPRSWSDLLWLPVALSRFSFDPMGALLPGLFLPPMVAGLIWFRRRNPLGLALAALPIAFVLLAAGLQLYPFGANDLGLAGKNGRVVLFLVPSGLLLLGAGLAWLREAPLRAQPRAALLLSALLAGGTLFRLLVFFPERRQELRPVLETVQDRRQPSDILYLYYGGQYTFEVYAPMVGLTDATVYRGRCARSTPAAYVADLSAIPQGARVWVVIGHPFGTEASLILEQLDRRGDRLETLTAMGAAAVLFDLSRAPEQRGPLAEALYEPPPPPWPGIGCRGVFAGLEGGWRPRGATWGRPN